MTIRKYSDHDNRPSARRRSHRMHRLRVQARSGDWRPAGTASDGFAYPEGEWPGKPVGGGRPIRPEKCIATHGERVRRGRGRLAGRFLVRDDEGQDVDEDTELEGDDTIAARPEVIR